MSWVVMRFSTTTDELIEEELLDDLLRERFRALLALPADESMIGASFRLTPAAQGFLEAFLGFRVEEADQEVFLEWKAPS